MKHILTFALSLAVVCSLGLPAFADYGKGGKGKSATPYNGPKVKNPKVKNPQPTPPTNPTTPPVILLSRPVPPKPAKTGVTMPIVPKVKPSITLPKLTQPNLSKSKVDKSVLPPGSQANEFGKHQTPHNPGPFPPHIFDKKNDKKHDHKKHDKDCHDCHDGHCHDGNGGHYHPPLDPGKGDGKPTPTEPTPPARPGFVWVPAKNGVPGHWERERAPTTTPTKPGFIWVPATATVPGHWERAKAK